MSKNEKKLEGRARSQNLCMGDLSINVILFMEKIMLKSHLVKTDYRDLRITKLDIYVAPVLSTDYSATVLAAKMCTNCHELSMYIRFLWNKPKLLFYFTRLFIRYLKFCVSQCDHI